MISHAWTLLNIAVFIVVSCARVAGRAKNNFMFFLWGFTGSVGLCGLITWAVIK